jgi:hypothetical protein
MKYALRIQSAYTAYAGSEKLWITPKKPMIRTPDCG